MIPMLIVTAAAVGLSTVAGAAIGLLFRNLSHRQHDIMLGAASGVMLAAAVIGLLLPAVGSENNAYALYLAVAGVFAGAGVVSVLDRITPHLHHLAGLDREETHRGNAGHSKTLLFISAIAIHKIPEGLAAGVSFGGGVDDVITVAGAIVLQNIPEAMVVIVPLLAIGVSVGRTILISAGIGLLSMLSTIAGAVLVCFTAPLVPFFLAFAGGAMLYVISDEMIPETHAHGFEKSATFAMISGFVLVLVLQKFL